jgi:hypothetical protein
MQRISQGPVNDPREHMGDPREHL